MVKHGTLDELEENYLLGHPQEVENYVQTVFAAYGEDGDSAALLASLRVIAKVKGISAIAKEAGLTRQGLQKSLSARGNPRLDSINSILHSLGFMFSVQRLS